MEKENLAVAFAALLHDIGKFQQRADEKGNHAEIGARFIDRFEFLFPFDWLDDLRDAVGNHHRPTVHKEIEKIVQVADWLASRERRVEPTIPRREPPETPLMPVAAHIDRGKPLPGEQWGFPLKALSLDKDALFPSKEAKVSPEDYNTLWKEFTGLLKRLKGRGPIKIHTLLAFLEGYTTFIPSATPWEEEEEHRTRPDISLFDHLKVTAAIAACLYHLYPDDLNALHRALRKGEVDESPVALMVRADFSGIQNFIYRITASRVDGTFQGAAKRLRGRSFYLSTLYDVVADWLARQLGLPITNILFCGGGQFDLLIPINMKAKLNDLEKDLQKWLLKEFYGELGVQIAVQELCPSDFENLRQVSNALNDELAEKKRRKFEGFVRRRYTPQEGDFLTPGEKRYHACNVCHLTPMDEPGSCDVCKEHLEIGRKLPHTRYLAYLYDWDKPLPGKAKWFDFSEPFRVTVALLDEGEAKALMQQVQGKESEVVLYRLNNTDFLREDAPENVALGFKFLANAAPIAKEKLPATPKLEAVERGDVLNFDRIAHLSEGAKLLGVLKADIDHLGFIFGEGIEPSISRVATLSRTIDLFFTGWLNVLCERIAELRSEEVRGAFYIVYSGGDDLLILGPWDQILELSRRLYADFRDYTCRNDNVTLSAGVLLVKPHFPIHRFARLVGEELDRAKESGRNRIAIFAETVEWLDGKERGFESLLEFGKALAERVEAKQLPKSFVYFLHGLHKQHFDEDREDIMWIPKFHYAVARRVSEEVIRELNLTMDVPEMMKHIRIPVSYVSLKTRKE